MMAWANRFLVAFHGAMWIQIRGPRLLAKIYNYLVEKVVIVINWANVLDGYEKKITAKFSKMVHGAKSFIYLHHIVINNVFPICSPHSCHGLAQYLW